MHSLAPESGPLASRPEDGSGRRPAVLNFSLLCLHLGGCSCEAWDPLGPQPLNPTV